MFIHGLVRDDKGRKMSKSLGNGIDPLEIADKYGADALRFNLVTGNSPGNDMRFYTERCEAMRNFANKIWNASRFLMMNLTIDDSAPLPEKLELEDKWILVQAQHCHPRGHREHGPATSWAWPPRRSTTSSGTTYCDWYIELTKTRLQGEDEDRQGAGPAGAVLCADRDPQAAPSLHALHHRGDLAGSAPRGASVPHAASSGRSTGRSWTSPAEEKAMELIMDAIRAVRTRRAEMNVPPSKKAHLTVATQERDVFAAGRALPEAPGLRQRRDRHRPRRWAATREEPPRAWSPSSPTRPSISMPLAELVDLEKEKARIEKDLKKNRGELQKLNNKLANPGFLAQGPGERGQGRAGARREADRPSSPSWKSRPRRSNHTHETPKHRPGLDTVMCPPGRSYLLPEKIKIFLRNL